MSGPALRARRRGSRVGLASALLLALAAGPVSADADPLPQRLEETRERIDAANAREGVLSSQIAAYGDRLERLRSEVAGLRVREARLAEELATAEAELARARARVERGEAKLAVLRDRLRGALRRLAALLVSIYKSDQPDAVTVILRADGFDDLLSRAEYLERIEGNRNAVVDRVRRLRDETRAAVERLRAAEAEIEAARNVIAERQEQLTATRRKLGEREARLSAATQREQEALASVRAQRSELERIAAGLQDRIQAQLAAGATPPGPAGPRALDDAASSDSELIWPVQGALTSPFGPRWGRLHAGIDIAAPGGTPIRAAAAGTVAMAGPNGGYGNYTCINHSGGLATCYAHQSSISTSTGALVSQGQMIGAVGNTGNSFGDHLHFEVRLNGVPQDPLGYL